MQRNQKHLLLLPLLLAFALGSKAVAADELNHVVFTASTDNIPNPERGIFHHLGVYPGSSAVTASYLKECRTQEGITLFFMMYHIDKFVSSDISDSFLTLIRTNMERLRQNGAKCILRFSYCSDTDKHPYDATWQWTKRHIEQLKPILTEYADVIALMEAGFVGVWGEWYYSDNYGFEPSRSQFGPRAQVLEALLDALPAKRFVSVRTPMAKLYCLNLQPKDSITATTAFSGTNASRVGFHDDAFLADDDDMGTFDGSQVYRLYVRRDTRYAPFGGETNTYSSYIALDHARQYMADYHLSYLNEDYLESVIAQWQKVGLLDEMRRRLGYRFQLTDAYLPSIVHTGGNMSLKLSIANVGWAAPFNARTCDVVLISSAGTMAARWSLGADPRRFEPGTTTLLEKTFTLPATLTEGDYTIALDLSDPEPTLAGNPLFSIRLANDGVWDETTGFNRLGTVHVALPDNISALSSATAGNNVRYNLSGTRLHGTPRGIYICNGKKYLSPNR
jgi:hypothetical protein